MDFSLSDEQELLRDTARALLADHCPPSLLRAHMDDPHAATRLWYHLRGFAPLGVGPLVDLCIFQEQLGAVAAPGPFFASVVLGAPLLDALGVEAEEPVTVALAGADGRWRPTSEGLKHFVPEVDTTGAVLAVDADGSVTRHVGPPARLVRTIDSTRRLFTVDTGGRGEPLGTVPTELVAALVERATIALAAEMVGTARTLLDRSLDYARARVQFGAPIGSFQAVQHKLADMSLDVERAGAAVAYAAMALDADDPDRHRAAHVAKAAAGEAARRAAKDGIQIHGGIGYTWDHDLHLFLRRALASEAFLGTTGEHHDALAALLIG